MPKVVLTEQESDIQELQNEILAGIAECRFKQKDIAEKLGVTQPAVSVMLKDISRMKLTDLMRLARATGREVVITRRGKKYDCR